MRRELVALGVFVAQLSPAAADPASDENRSGTSTLVPDSIPGVNPALAVPSNASIAAAVTGVASGTQYRVTFLPAKAFNAPYHVWSESKLTLTYDSRNSLATIGYSLAYNPFSFRGPRLSSLIASLDSDAMCGARYDAATHGISTARVALTVADTKLNRDVTANAPAAVIQADRKAVQDAEDNVARILGNAKPIEAACTRQRLAAEWAVVYGTWIPQLTATVVAGVFPAGRGADPMAASLNAPLEPWQGVSTNLEAMFRPDERVTLNLLGSFKNTRPSGAPRTRRSNTEGAGITIAVLAWPFLSDKDLHENADYLAEGFIPGLGLGASLQAFRCEGGPYCDSGKVRAYSATPFLDVRLKPSVQFRISVPIERSLSVMTATGTAITPTFTLSSAIGSL